MKHSWETPARAIQCAASALILAGVIGAAALSSPEASKSDTLTVATMRALKATTIPRGTAIAHLAGYYARGDGGGGWFRWDPDDNATRDDGGTVIASAVPGASGRWKRIVRGTEPLDLRWFGGKNGGVFDNSPPMQAAIDAVSAARQNSGRRIFIPAGTWNFGATLRISAAGLKFIGAASEFWDAQNGTVLRFAGSGDFFRIGADDGRPWDAGEYNGLSNTEFHDLALTTRDPDATGANGTAGLYRAGACAIRDWRGGGIRIKNVWISHFENGFWGINSDFNYFEWLQCNYNHVGIYFGPRSDQGVFNLVQGVGNDTFLRLDGASKLTSIGLCSVNNGSPTTFGIDIGCQAQFTRANCRDCSFINPWFEVNSTRNNLRAFVRIDAATDAPVTGIVFDNPYASGPYFPKTPYCQSFAQIGNATQISIQHLSLPPMFQHLLNFTPPKSSRPQIVALSGFTGTGTRPPQTDYAAEKGAVPAVDVQFAGPRGWELANPLQIGGRLSVETIGRTTDAAVRPTTGVLQVAAGAGVVVGSTSSDDLRLRSSNADRLELRRRGEVVWAQSAGESTVDSGSTIAVQGVDSVIRVKTRAAATAVVMQPGIAAGQVIQLRNASPHPITFAPRGASHVAGGAAKVIPPWTTVTLEYDGNDWN